MQDDIDRYLRIYDPLKVEVLKGRPRGTGPFAFAEPTTQRSLPSAQGNQRIPASSRRQPSQWEGIDLTAEDEVDQALPPSTAPAAIQTIRKQGQPKKTIGKPKAKKVNTSRGKAGRPRYRTLLPTPVTPAPVTPAQLAQPA